MPIPKLRRVYGALRGQSASTKLKAQLAGLTWRQYARIFLYGGGIFFIGGSVFLIAVTQNLPDPTKLSEQRAAQSTKIFDRTGTHLLYEVYESEKRTVVSAENISPFVAQAFVAIEDKHFYEHNGIRVVSVLRAGFNNLIGRKIGSGGASTLTQQLVKNALVGDKRTIWRKVREAIVSVRLEKKYSKAEILNLYLNQIPLGSTNYGVEAAAQSYFHKTAKDVTLAEAATLAAMNQAPSRYLNNLDGLRGRRDLVLRLMFEQKYITEAQKTQAQGEALRVFRGKGIFAAPHFVLYVKQLLGDQFGEQLVDTGGLKVLTSLDYDKQIMAEKIVKEQGEKFAKQSDANNASLVAIDPATGQILTLVGSRQFDDEKIDGQFNVATLGKLQPGSSFKPFVYLAAFEKGYTPETVLYDVLTDFDARGGKKYSPQNYDHKEHGLLTMRSALQNSLNIPAVKALYLVGVEQTLEFAKRFGYTTFAGKDCGLSLVLGGCEVNLLEHTNAYAALANNGVYHAPVAILKVENANGEALAEWQQNEGSEAVKPELAATITNVLADNEARAMVFGLKNNLTLPGREVAAKTGTTNNSKDAWTMGYVPSLAAGVWVGNTPLPKPMKGGGNLLAGVIWNQFMRQALATSTPELFPTPPPSDATKPVLTGSVGGVRVRLNARTGKIAAPGTPDALVTVRTYLPPHDILHYVIKDDPRGPMPMSPGDDPQYQAWETGLQGWLARQQAAGVALTLEEPPTEVDNEVSAEFVPTVEAVLPAAGQVIKTRDITFQARATAPRGVAQVLYFIDGLEVARSSEFPFTAQYHAGQLTLGPHLIRIIAVDDLGNSGSTEFPINMQAEPDPATFSWSDGEQVTYVSDDFPRVIFLEPFRWEDIVNIKIFLKSAAEEKQIYDFNHKEDNLFGGKLTFTWKHSPGSGTYSLRAVMTDKAGRVIEKVLQVAVQ